MGSEGSDHSRAPLSDMKITMELAYRPEDFKAMFKRLANRLGDKGFKGIQQYMDAMGIEPESELTKMLCKIFGKASPSKVDDANMPGPKGHKRKKS